ncbi:MAG: 4Fe-4S dicluster domain-containing protein [Clostridiales bacterium]|nr:4Fe-4S dicluster domain-containing protein [Clostridiales bacterium]
MNSLNLLASVDFTTVGIVLAVVAVIAIVFAILIVTVSKLCAVKEDEKVKEITSLLSGANCGGCGFKGCADFAQALANGKTDISECSATSPENKREIAKILGIDAGDTEEKIAVICCCGGDGATDKFNYVGNLSCSAQVSTMGGKKACSFACLGGGDCAIACEEKGISIMDGVACGDKKSCVSCKRCIKVCPKGIIHLIPKKAKVYVACSSNEKGKDVLSVCKTGCIACGICAKNCPENAITMENNLPVIDYKKCVGCMLCAEKCPRKTIKTL